MSDLGPDNSRVDKNETSFTANFTFLFTDIEGSTRLWDKHPGIMQTALARHDQILREAIVANEGQVFKTVGDAFYAVFRDGVKALEAALAAQHLLKAAEWETEIGEIKVRMALHSGPAQQRNSDYFGPTLNRISRIVGIGHGGQLLLSQAMAELVRERLPKEIELRDLGQRRLKDLVRPEHIFQVIAPNLSSEFPPLKTLDLAPTNLPAQLTSFVGREREIAEIKAMLIAKQGNKAIPVHLLTLTGAGGVGKTRLSLQVAAELLDQFPEGVWFVELAALTDPALVSQAIAEALNLTEDKNKPLLTTVTDYLKSRQILLVLDNCEHLVEECARVIDHLIKHCPRLQILATSRESFEITGESSFRVPSLAVPNDPARHRLPPLEKLLEYEGVRLFVERAVTINPNFRLTEQNAAALAQLCRHLDGIPLALELAAARVKVLSLEQINTRLKDRFRLLTGGSRVALPRQQTLRALIDWSYDMLSLPEQVLWQRLSIFSGGWTLEAAEQICAGDPLEEFEILDWLRQLVNKSLVLVEEQEEEGAVRYRFLETIRQYGGEKLSAVGEQDEMRKRRLEYFLALAERTAPQLVGAEQSKGLKQLEAEHDNLRAILYRTAYVSENELPQPEKIEAGLRLAEALLQFWMTCSYFTEGRRYLSDLLKVAQKAGLSHRLNYAHALRSLGSLAGQQSDLAAAQPALEESLALYRELEDKTGIAQTLHGLGVIALLQGNFASAQALLEESIALKRPSGDKRGIALSLNSLGVIANAQGNRLKAQAIYQESLQLMKELGDKRGVAYILSNLGNLALNQGDFNTAQKFHRESLQIKRELRDKWGIAVTLDALGSLAANQKDYFTAQTFYEESLVISRELEDEAGIADLLKNLGLIALDQKNFTQAQSYLRESLEIQKELGDKRAIAHLLSGLAGVACGVGNEAETTKRISYFQKAARLCGVASALLTTIKAVMEIAELDIYNETLNIVRTQLGEEKFTLVFTEGQTMPLDQAVNYALQNEVF